MSIKPKTFRATGDILIGRHSFKKGEIIPAGTLVLDRLIALGKAAADKRRGDDTSPADDESNTVDDGGKIDDATASDDASTGADDDDAESKTKQPKTKQEEPTQ